MSLCYEISISEIVSLSNLVGAILAIMKAGEVKIPTSALQTELNQVAILVRDAQALLAELETGYLGRKSSKAGGWRQTPTEWSKQRRI